MTGAARRHGLTLIELLIVLALACILLGVGMPSLSESLRRMRLQAATNDLVAAIELTRSQAIARGGKVMLAPLDPSGTDWRQGWIVFQDINGNRRPDAGEPLIYRHGPLRDDLRVESRFTSGGAQAYLAYNAAGRSCNASNSLAARWGTLSLTQGEHARNIKINMLGRVRVCDPEHDGAACSGASD
ncbi:GspH/FimT family pseudopilin [Duganella callida]|uniref:Type II secretion system protein H n=1 Tax=Duganella callida TaxID=2561932 RepID=A0A4Y9SDS4_9BURK|nr:GspH/FimT family pseudopilin [Duganella callida]TFW20904.1 prepilin-type N-terminal cleavage/methylation domain-containing protein [Duganella callida]